MKFFLVFILFFLSGVLSAKESGFSLSAALVGMSMDYREYDDSDYILDSEESNFGEMTGGDFTFVYTEALVSDNYMELSANLGLIAGETEYVGSYIDSELGYGSVVERTKNIIFDSSVEYEFNQVFENGVELSYGIGLGYRSWRRELSPSQIEVYTWYSLRQKTAISYSLKNFSFGAGFEYQHGVNPTMTILADYENPDTTVNLRSANIVELTLPMYVTLNEKLELFVEYIYQHQTIEKSNMAPYVFNGMPTRVYEPRSTAYNQYAKFGAVFKF